MVEAKTASDGTEYNLCRFNNDNACSEWLFYSGLCGQDFIK